MDQEIKPKKWENTKAYRIIKHGMMADLEERGLRGAIYRDKVEEYLSLWVQFQQLREDVQINGVTLFDKKKGMPVQNRSVSMGVQVSRQMLNIYTALGFKELAGREAGAGDVEDLTTLGELLKP